MPRHIMLSGILLQGQYFCSVMLLALDLSLVEFISLRKHGDFQALKSSPETVNQNTGALFCLRIEMSFRKRSTGLRVICAVLQTWHCHSAGVRLRVSQLQSQKCRFLIYKRRENEGFLQIITHQKTQCVQQMNSEQLWLNNSQGAEDHCWPYPLLLPIFPLSGFTKSLGLSPQFPKQPSMLILLEIIQQQGQAFITVVLDWCMFSNFSRRMTLKVILQRGQKHMRGWLCSAVTRLKRKICPSLFCGNLS